MAKNQIFKLGRNGKAGSQILALEAHLGNKGFDDKSDPLELSPLERFVLRLNTKAGGKSSSIYVNIPAMDVAYIADNTKLAKRKASKEPYTVYDSQMKHMRVTDDKGNNKVYQIVITADYSRRYPFIVRIENAFAPLAKAASGQTTIEISKKVNSEVNSLYLTEKEWFNLASYMETIYNNYISMTFKERFEATK